MSKGLTTADRLQSIIAFRIRPKTDEAESMATELLALRRDRAELLQAARDVMDHSDPSSTFRYAAESVGCRERLAAILKRHGA